LVAFSHGATADHTMFDDQVEAITSRYRMLRWDMRGQGLSRPATLPFSCERAAHDLRAILDRLSEERVALVGQSIGGNVGQEFIFQYPDRCAAAIFLGCTCSTWRLTLLDRALLAVVPRLLELYSPEALARAAVRTSAITENARHRYARMIAPLNKPEIIVIMSEIVRGLHPEPHHMIACPIAIAYGDHDELGNIKKVAAAWAARDGAPPPYVIPNAGHLANMDNPEAFNRVMLDFLAAHYPSAASGTRL
jgi:pimeloyl-ACP methyl ester carboxylesterase